MNENFNETRNQIGYTPRKETPAEVYQALGLKCGLEVHQQLKTDKKLFCHCPAGIYQKAGEYQAEVVRHMRPTLSEMGGYDGTALMEFKTKKNIVYRIANQTTCTYDVDDTPPFKINYQALKIAIEIALLLKTNIVGELHITRKQYLDGSIPTGFQRTAIVSIEGQFPIKNKKIGVIQLSIEEDSCREVSDIGHTRIYTTDRLGMPLIEVVTYPDMNTPNEVKEAGQYIRFLNRSTGKVRTGIGAAREDVNVSIHGGTRVEIKGVSHISLIPELVHNEAFRQKSLLKIQEILKERIPDHRDWGIWHVAINGTSMHPLPLLLQQAANKDYTFVAINLPGFKNILSFFTQPGRMFSDEISDRLKVIACIEKPNMIHSEDFDTNNYDSLWKYIHKLFSIREEDAQILIWGAKEDIPTALEVIEERCKMAFLGVPNETRKSYKNGTTSFERVLPGADRMYPDTDSPPISIKEEVITDIRNQLPIEVDKRINQLKSWRVPEDTYFYILRNNLVPLMERVLRDFGVRPLFSATLLAHRLKYIQGHIQPDSSFNYERIYELFKFAKQQNIQQELLLKMLPFIYRHPNMDMVSVLDGIGFLRYTKENIVSLIPQLHEKFKSINTSRDDNAEFRWMMKELSKIAKGNMPMGELACIIQREVYAIE